MRVSIITATYNSEGNLRDCLQSVANQNYPKIEHIVVDGGSQDRTMEIVKSFSSVSRYVSEPDRGIYDALNKGIQMATGDVIGFVHSDDILAGHDVISKIVATFTTDHTATQELHSLPPGDDSVLSAEDNNTTKEDYLAEEELVFSYPTRYTSLKRRRKVCAPKVDPNTNFDGVYGDLVFVDTVDTRKVLRTWISTPFNNKDVKRGWAPPHPTLYLRREVYEQHGLFDISFRIAGDYDQMLRIMRNQTVNLGYIPETVVHMRKGGASTGSLKLLLYKMGEDVRAMQKNGFRFPLMVLLIKNIRKIPQLTVRGVISHFVEQVLMTKDRPLQFRKSSLQS